MPYSSGKIEEWIVGSNCFWHKGDVQPSEYHVPFTGTWEQVSERSEEMARMEKRHYEERFALAARQHAERKTLWH